MTILLIFLILCDMLFGVFVCVLWLVSNVICVLDCHFGFLLLDCHFGFLLLDCHFGFLLLDYHFGFLLLDCHFGFLLLDCHFGFLLLDCHFGFLLLDCHFGFIWRLFRDTLIIHLNHASNKTIQLFKICSNIKQSFPIYNNSWN
jgi:hypothetical protein